MDVRVGLKAERLIKAQLRNLSTKQLMLLNYGVGEDSYFDWKIE